jgi:hypothetical protein
MGSPKLFAWPEIVILLTASSHVAWIAHMGHHDQLSFEGVSRTPCLGWLQTAILLILPFQEFRIIDVSQWHPAKSRSKREV